MDDGTGIIEALLAQSEAINALQSDMKRLREQDVPMLLRSIDELRKEVKVQNGRVWENKLSITQLHTSMRVLGTGLVLAIIVEIVLKLWM